MSDFKEIWILSTKFRIILKFQISWKSIHWEPSCSIRSDRQTRQIYGPLFAVSRTPPQNWSYIYIVRWTGKRKRTKLLGVYVIWQNKMACNLCLCVKYFSKQKMRRQIRHVTGLGNNLIRHSIKGNEMKNGMLNKRSGSLTFLSVKHRLMFLYNLTLNLEEKTLWCLSLFKFHIYFTESVRLSKIKLNVCYELLLRPVTQKVKGYECKAWGLKPSLMDHYWLNQIKTANTHFYQLWNTTMSNISYRET